MTRTSFTHDLETREHYLSLVFQKIPGEATWTLLNQGRAFSPEVTADEKDYRRIGDKEITTRAGAKKTAVTIDLYVEDDFSEVARICGTPKPGGGWTGSEEIELDTDFEADYKIENYDGTETTAAIVATEYINQFRPARLGPPLDAEGDVRIASFSGSARSYYIIPAAG